MYGVLFVSSGKLCRSPTAEGVFRQMVAEADLAHRIGADSVGMFADHIGKPPDRRAWEAARLRGYEIGDLRARQLQIRDFQDFHLILAMDGDRYRRLFRCCPAGKRHKLAIFLEAAPQCGQMDVPDPYYGNARDFEIALDLIEAGARGWLYKIRAALNACGEDNGLHHPSNGYSASGV